MEHADHVALIRAGVAGAGPHWLELGAGEGAFTLALADLLGGGRIVAVDRDAAALARLEAAMRRRFPATTLETRRQDFTGPLPPGPFDGVLAANSLHFVRDPLPVLGAVRDSLVPGGRFVLVEYDSDDGNPWVPHPISFERWRRLAPAAGFTRPARLHTVPSRFLRAIYGARSERPRDARLPGLHGGDREE